MFQSLNNHKKRGLYQTSLFFFCISLNKVKIPDIRDFYFIISQGIVNDHVSITLPGITVVLAQVFTLSQIIAHNFLFHESINFS
jgi:hypothetical protein